MNKTMLSIVAFASLVVGLSAATMPASARDHRSNFGITLGIGAPVVGYNDGYYASDGRFYNWNQNNYNYDTWSRQNNERSFGYRHDERRYGDRNDRRDNH